MNWVQLLLLTATVSSVAVAVAGTAAGKAILENYERKLNSVLQTSGKRTIKRFKCVEEYVTLDDNGVAVESRRGHTFSTAQPPSNRHLPVALTQARKEYALPAQDDEFRKPEKAVKEAKPVRVEPTTGSPIVVKATNQAPPASKSPTRVPPLEELDDEDADRLIEQLYLQKRDSHVESGTTRYTTSPSTAAPPPAVERVRPEKPPAKLQYWKPHSRNASPKRVFPILRSRDYDDYGDDFEFYERRRPPLRRRAFASMVHRRRRPIVYVDDVYDVDYAKEMGSQAARQRNHPAGEASPLKPLARLRHQRRIKSFPPPPLPLATTSFPAAPPPATVLPALPPSPPPPSTIPDAQDLQKATPENCQKITFLAKRFGITDVSKWARGNCAFLQMYAPSASCELIFHFIDSCHRKKFFN